MTEQQNYRVIADRDKGDRIGPGMIQPLDRVTYVTDEDKVLEHLVRIERPVPTTDRPDLTRDQFSSDESYYLATGRHPSLPTREQIAEALHQVVENGSWSNADEVEPLIADAVLTLLQKGADR